jgi:PAS domain S-box-containing protein
MLESLEILIVDDNRELAENFRDILFENEYSALIANDGKEAINFCQNGEFALGIIDIKLPDYDGVNLVFELTKLNPDMDFIMITGYGTLESAVEAIKIKNIISYNLKPVNFTRILEIIRQVNEKKLSERNLRKAEDKIIQSEIKYQTIFESNNDAIMLLNSQGFFDCNPQALKIFGFTQKNEFIKVHPSDISPALQPDGKDSLTASNEKIQYAYEHGYNSFKWIHQRTNGENFPAEVLLSAFKYEDEMVLQATVRDITKRTLVKNSLLESEAELRAITNSANDCIIMMDDKGKICFWNPAAEKIFGYSESEAIGKNLHKLIVPNRFLQSHLEAFPKWQKTGSGGAVGKILELAGIKKGGTEFPLEFSLSSVKHDKHWMAVGIIRDITERKIAETKIKKFNQELEVMVNDRTIKLEEAYNSLKLKEIDLIKNEYSLKHAQRVTKLGSYSFELRTGLWSGSEELENILGTFENENKNLELLKKIIHPNHKDRLTEYFERNKASINQTYEWECPIINLKSKEMKWIKGLGELEFDYQGLPLRMNGSIQDITDQKKQKFELLNSFKELQLAHSKLDQTYKELKQTQSQLVQSEKMVALGQLIAGIAHEINSPLSAIKSQNDSYGREIGLVFQKLPIIMKSLPDDILDIISEIFRSNAVDIPMLTLKEERVKKRELLDVFEKMDLNNPSRLATLFLSIGNKDLIEKYKPVLMHKNNIEILKFISKLVAMNNGSAMIKNAVDSIMKIVFALKSYTHYDSLDEPVLSDISKGIDTVLTLYKNKIKHNIELTINYIYKEPILCYPDELNQVWANIIHNSLHAMDYKGKIDIKVYEKNAHVVASISDSGRGIPDEIKEKIFEPFFTNKPLGEGSGIGLDIVKKIVEKLNGQIEFKSTVNIGTTFYIILPIIQEKING